VDGIDVSREPAGPGARPFAWVPQEAPLITATIAENVSLLTGDPDRAPEVLRLMGAERLAARAHDEIVGPSGVALSGGERRQIAVARAVSTGLPVLLLDEPTEGLDAESARAVCDILRALRGERTILIATHRPEVVAIADQILRLDATDAIAAE
jgi:ABC-type transport system involved in cytochrome bd biosynthesis fused ATPase/permease subunit